MTSSISPPRLHIPPPPPPTHMIHPHHISSSSTMENWTKPTRKSMRFPIMVVVVALASAPVLIKPFSFISLVHFTRELKDSFSAWMTAPFLFFLVNLIIMAILAMSRFNHNLDWTEYNHSHGGKVKEISTPNEKGDQFQGRVKEIRLRDQFEGGVREIGMKSDRFHGGVKEIRLPNERGDHLEARMEEISLPNETGVEEEEEMCPKTPNMCTELGFPGANGKDKMLSGERFTSRRSSISKGKKMGQSLKVSHVEKDREDTLESVWKKISEGRRPPLARHLRSGTSRLHKAEGTEESDLQMVLARVRSGGSAGQDELNKRVEAFIAKVNQDIKLQKQDSIRGYADMIQRGAI